MAITVDVDIAGTFTDGFITRDGEIITDKVDATPHDLTDCFVSCLEAGAPALGLSLKGILPQTDDSPNRPNQISTPFSGNDPDPHRN
jgi:hypothetical protein